MCGGAREAVGSAVVGSGEDDVVPVSAARAGGGARVAASRSLVCPPSRGCRCAAPIVPNRCVLRSIFTARKSVGCRGGSQPARGPHR